MRNTFMFGIFCVLVVVQCVYGALPITVSHVTSPTSSGGHFTITGTNFVQPDLDLKVELFFVNSVIGFLMGPCEIAVDYTTNTKVVCNGPPGVGGNYHSRIGLLEDGEDEPVVAAWFNFSYAAPVIDAIIAENPLSVESGSTVTLIGRNFASSMLAHVEGVLAPEITELSDNEVTVVLPPGIGTKNEISLSVGPEVPLGFFESIPPGGPGNEKKRDAAYLSGFNFSWHLTTTSTAQIAYTNPMPYLEDCDSDPLTDATTNYTSGLTLTVCGANFMPFIGAKRELWDSEWTGEVKVTVGGQVCEITRLWFTVIECTVPSNVYGSAAVVADINGVILNAPYTIEYPSAPATTTAAPGPAGPPVVTSVTPTTLSAIAHRSVLLGTTITIRGYNFGPNTNYYNTRRTIHFGQFACVNVKYVANGVLTCVLLPSTNVVGQNLAVSITIAGLSNDVFTSPVLDTTLPENTPGLACSFPNGAIDTTNFDMCNCFSGFAPHSANDDCSVAAMCPGHIISKTQIGGSAPSRPHTTFSNDKLTVVQTSPIVHGRRDYHLWFVSNQTNSAQTCNYPGPIWTKTVSSLDCLDVYTMVMPWSQNGLCGFEKIDGEVTFNTYTATLVSVYRDIIVSNNVPAVRSATVSHLVTVKFQRQLTIALESTNIQPVDYDNSDITIEIIEDALYDPATLETLIAFDTTTSAPYQLQALAGYWVASSDNIVPTGGNASIVVSLQTPQPGNLECGSFKDTCAQRWTMRIKTVGDNGVSVCNLKGHIDLVPSVLCRDPETAPSACPASAPTPTNATIVFATETQLCDVSDDDVDAAAGLDFAITTFEDAGFAAPQNTFQPADVAYFQIAVIDPAGTIDGITFNTITLSTDNGEVDPLYDVNDNTVVPPAAAHFNITSELNKGVDEPLSPGSIAIISFRVTLSRQLDTVGSLSSTTDAAALSAHVVADIVYHGNNKRSVVVQNSLQKSAVARIVIVGGSYADEADEVANNEEDLEFSLLGSSAVPSSSFSLFVLLAVALCALTL